MPYTEVVQKYCESTIFVFPSVWEEPFGMPIIEAMACGKPVIATKSGGITELVEDQKTGFLVDRDDPKKLADTIIRLTSEPGRIKKYGKAGRSSVIQKYSWDKVVIDLIALYQKVL